MVGCWRKTALWCCAGVLAVAVVIPVPSGMSAVTETSAVPAKLVGTWTRKVTSADVKRENMTDQDVIDAGAGTVWTLRITKRSPASLYGIKYFTGPIIPAGANRVHIFVGFFYPNVYKWRVSGRLLTLTKVNDSLPIRAAVLRGVWKRK